MWLHWSCVIQVFGETVSCELPAMLRLAFWFVAFSSHWSEETLATGHPGDDTVYWGQATWPSVLSSSL